MAFLNVFLLFIFFENVFASQSGGHRVWMGQDVVVRRTESLRKVVVIGGKLDFDGSADDIIVINGSLKLGPDAVVARRVVVVWGDLLQNPQAAVGENIVHIKRNSFNTSEVMDWVDLAMVGRSMLGERPFQRAIKLAFVLCMCALSMLFYLVFQQGIYARLETARHFPLRSFLFSFVFLCLIVLTLVACVVSLIGIFALPMVFMLLLALAVYTLTMLVSSTGDMVFFALPQSPRWIRYLCGLVVMAFLLMNVHALYIPVAIVLFWLSGATVFHSFSKRRRLT
jgi:hypothetical protein